MQMVLDITNELNELLNNIKGDKESFIIKKITKELRIIRGDSFTIEELDELEFTSDELNRIGFNKDEIEDIKEGLKDFESGKYITDEEMDKVFSDN